MKKGLFFLFLWAYGAQAVLAQSSTSTFGVDPTSITDTSAEVSALLFSGTATDTVFYYGEVANSVAGAFIPASDTLFVVGSVGVTTVSVLLDSLPSGVALWARIRSYIMPDTVPVYGQISGSPVSFTTLVAPMVGQVTLTQDEATPNSVTVNLAYACGNVQTTYHITWWDELVQLGSDSLVLQNQGDTTYTIYGLASQDTISVMVWSENMVGSSGFPETLDVVTLVYDAPIVSSSVSVGNPGDATATTVVNLGSWAGVSGFALVANLTDSLGVIIQTNTSSVLNDTTVVWSVDSLLDAVPYQWSFVLDSAGIAVSMDTVPFISSAWVPANLNVTITNNVLGTIVFSAGYNPGTVGFGTLSATCFDASWQAIQSFPADTFVGPGFAGYTVSGLGDSLQYYMVVSYSTSVGTIVDTTSWVSVPFQGIEIVNMQTVIVSQDTATVSVTFHPGNYADGTIAGALYSASWNLIANFPGVYYQGPGMHVFGFGTDPATQYFFVAAYVNGTTTVYDTLAISSLQVPPPSGSLGAVSTTQSSMDVQVYVNPNGSWTGSPVTVGYTIMNVNQGTVVESGVLPQTVNSAQWITFTRGNLLGGTTCVVMFTLSNAGGQVALAEVTAVLQATTLPEIIMNLTSSGTNSVTVTIHVNGHGNQQELSIGMELDGIIVDQLDTLVSSGVSDVVRNFGPYPNCTSVKAQAQVMNFEFGSQAATNSLVQVVETYCPPTSGTGIEEIILQHGGNKNIKEIASMNGCKIDSWYQVHWGDLPSGLYVLIFADGFAAKVAK